MNFNLTRTALAAALFATGGTWSAAGFADPILSFDNMFAWVAGSQTCTDEGTGATCDGSPTDDLIVYSSPVPGLGADAFEQASWRNFSPEDGQAPDSPLSFMTTTGNADSLAPGETKILSEFFHDNNVLSPFGEAFNWTMALRNSISVSIQGGREVFGLPPNEFQFDFVESLNRFPCDLTDNPLGSECDDRWTGVGTAALIGPIPLVGPEFAEGSQLIVGVEDASDNADNIDFQVTGNDIVVHTREPEDSRLRFTLTYDSRMVMAPEPATIALVGGLALMMGGVAARRRARRRS